MENLNEHVKKYTIKHSRTIKTICAPFCEYLDISLFGYFRINSDGMFGALSNYPENLDYFSQENMHLNYPYLIHPSLLRSGYVFTSIGGNAQDSEKLFERFQMYHLLINIKHLGQDLEGFVFASKGRSTECTMALYPKLEMMNKFIKHFKREAKSLLGKMMRDGINLKAAKGKAFFQVDPKLPLSNTDPEALKFLKALAPLSAREHQCLELFKQGNSAQSTAAILGLSQRTVEHYFDNIKNKLGCKSKWELLDW